MILPPRFRRAKFLITVSLAFGAIWGGEFSWAYEKAPKTVSVFDLSFEELASIRVVTAASGYAQDSLKAPASVTVINNSEWTGRGARDLLTALRPVLGLYSARAQTGASRGTLFLRGLSGTFGQQVLTLVDGVSLGDPFYGGLPTSSRVPLLGIKRIEIVRGPGSAVYGADAFGGVVNLVSYEPDEIPSQVVSRYGAFDRFEVGVTQGWNGKDFGLQVAYEYQRSRDDPDKRVESDLQTTFDSLFGTRASLAPGRIDESYSISNLHVKGRWKFLTFSLLDWRNLDGGMGAGTAQALDPGGEHRRTIDTIDLGVELPDLVPGDLSFHLVQRFDRETNHFRLLPPGAVAPIGADGNLDFITPRNLVLFSEGLIGAPNASWSITTARLTHVWDWSERNRLRWELGHQWVRVKVQERKNFGPGVIDGSETVVDGTLTDVTGTPYIFFPNKRREVFNLSVQDEFQLNEKLNMNLGVRHDAYSDFGGTTNPRASVSYAFSKELTLRASAGTAFRAPAFVELYTINNPVGLGNPNLHPETLETGEVGVLATLPFARSLSLEASAFSYRAKRLIRFVETAQPGTQRATNVGTQDGAGIELAGRWQVNPRLSWDFNYTALRTRNEWGTTPADIPRQMGNVGVNYSPTSTWRTYLGAKWVADRARSYRDTRPAIPDFVAGTARVEKDFDRLTLSLTLDNLFDDDIRLPSYGAIPDDYPQEGFNWMLEAILRF